MDQRNGVCSARGWAAIVIAVSGLLGQGCDRDFTFPAHPTPRRDTGARNTADDATPGDAAPEAGPGAARDANQANGNTDAARRCETDEDCDDGVRCTRDVCNDRGFCTHRADSASCSDGVWCNGVEQCDPQAGCVSGDVAPCDDDDPCTIDRCDADADRCRHRPRDFDDDGEADARCGGTDCDDLDPTRGADVAELCGDGADNDCDGRVDESDCGRAPHDTCDDAFEIDGSGTYVLDHRGTVTDYELTCSDRDARDLVARFELTEPRDMRITVQSDERTWAALRRRCPDRETEIECHEDGAPLRARALEPGTWFVVVEQGAPGPVGLEVELTAPSPPPSNEGCSAPAPLDGGGTVRGSFVDVADDLETPCGRNSAPDRVYSITLDAPKDVVVSALAEDGSRLYVDVRATCDAAAMSRRCVCGAPLTTRVHALPAGTWFIVVEAPPDREPDFRLDVELEPPSQAPVGDSCARPASLEPGTTADMLGNKQDTMKTGCRGCEADAVYQFELAEARDVTLRARGGRTMGLSVRRTCEESEAELRCRSCRPATARIRNLAAGTYYAIVEAREREGFDLALETSAPSSITEVGANDTCDDAFPIPAEGGLFEGSTEGLTDDLQTEVLCGTRARSPDAVFRLSLERERRVVLDTAGSDFDTVLHVHQGMCESGAAQFCDDDAPCGVTSRMERVLEPGTWFVVVDGHNEDTTGRYLLDVQLQTP